MTEREKHLRRAAAQHVVATYAARELPNALGRTHASHESASSFHHRGFDVVVRSSHVVTVDGRRLPIAIAFSPNRTFESHALPYEQFMSAEELVATALDVYGRHLGGLRHPDNDNHDHG